MQLEYAVTLLVNGFRMFFNEAIFAESCVALNRFSNKLREETPIKNDD